ncbi:MAG TPA: hypothetical protein VGH87_28295 [Polyangiaceae bacterium]|jgi:hypothetical protein|nr:hypothetical protein [Polyangiaceae bacterium]
MNGWRPAAFAAMTCASLACGGKLADDTAAPGDAAMDATTDVGLGWTETGPPFADAQPPPPPTSCDYAAPEIATDTNGLCSTSETWTCDGGFYEVQCNCWSHTCECYGNGDKLLAFGFEGCPSCTLGSDVIAKCPH